MIMFIVGYLLGGFFGGGFMILKYHIEDQRAEKAYEKGYIDGVQSVR